MKEADLAERLLRGDRSAVPDALNLIDDRRPERQARALRLLDALERAEGRARRVGLTGAPGSGKSTLLEALVRALRAREQSVGILAVDPSSQRSGGALLGDRFRVRSGSRDRGVFLRSMAARDRLGGLAEATWAGAAVLAAVFDWVCVETVGVGQSESDVAELVDTLVFVAQPGAGDTLQFMKAGLVELPDVFVVNKADLGAAAERTAHELEAGVRLGEGSAAGWTPPVLRVSARSGAGVEAIVDAVEAHRAHLEAVGALAARRERGRLAFVRRHLEQRYGSYGLERLGGPAGLAARVREHPERSPFSLADELGREIEQRLAARQEGSR